MRTETELRAKLAEAGENLNWCDIDKDSRRYWERFAIKLRVVLAYPMLTEKEVCARLDAYITKMDRPFLKASRIMFWASEAAYLQWILQPPEPIIDEAKVAKAQAKANSTGKSVYVWADAKGTHTATKPPGGKFRTLVTEEKPEKRRKGLYVHIPKGVGVRTPRPGVSVG